MGYLAWRLLQIVPMLFAVGTVLFVLLHLTPGGPIVALAGEYADATTVQSIERQLGLDRSLPEQYVRYMASLARGDLGQSYFYKAPVLDIVLSRVPATLVLIVPSLMYAMLLGIPLGIRAARTEKVGLLVIAFALVAFAIPVFWLGHLLRLGLSVGAGWFPVQGMVDARSDVEGIPRVLDVARHAALPWLTLTLHQLAFTVLLTRAAMRVETRRGYFVTALAFGQTRWQAELKHAFPNASLSILTLFCNRFGSFIAGAVLVETVFAWPGLGQLVSGAIVNRDYPLIIGVVLFVTTVTLVANVIADIVAAWIDPRIRLRRMRA